LLQGDEVSGLVDFGAMRVETVAGDIARLLGSIARDHPRKWQTGLSAYEAIRPLAASERTLVALFDRSAVLLSCLNWIEWIYAEGRTFAALDSSAARLARTLERLELLALDPERASTPAWETFAG